VDDDTGGVVVTVIRVGSDIAGDRVRYRLSGPVGGPTLEFGNLADAQQSAAALAANGQASRSEARRTTRK